MDGTKVLDMGLVMDYLNWIGDEIDRKRGIPEEGKEEFERLKKYLEELGAKRVEKGWGALSVYVEYMGRVAAYSGGMDEAHRIMEFFEPLVRTGLMVEIDNEYYLVPRWIVSKKYSLFYQGLTPRMRFKIIKETKKAVLLRNIATDIEEWVPKSVLVKIVNWKPKRLAEAYKAEVEQIAKERR